MCICVGTHRAYKRMLPGSLQVFVELEIPHIYHSVARNSPKRQELVDKWDVFQVPYIEVCQQ